MTDVDQIARGIAVNVASLLNYVPALADSNYAAVIEEIAATLREADAEGYRRAEDKFKKIILRFTENESAQQKLMWSQLQRDGKGEGA